MKIQAKKSLGQHFLNSKHVLNQIVSAAEIKKGDLVLEIGPGTGVLTKALLENGAEVLAIEKDSRSIELLPKKFPPEIGSGQLKLLEKDILEFSDYPKRQFSIVANIPYYITGAILEKFLGHSPRPEKMVLLVQREVAERIVARNNKESILSVSVKAFGRPKIVAVVPPGAFTPPPSVDSAIITISNISNSLFPNEDMVEPFFRIVRSGFAHKRKILIRNLEASTDPSRLSEIWKILSLDQKIRAEDLKISDWLMICKKILG